MAKLLWDQTSERFFEAGIDRGVLYLSDGRGVSWSGLTGVEEDFGDDGTNSVYYDGVKTKDIPSIGNYAATLTALTYPDEFTEYEGLGSLGNGLYVDDQPPKTFGLSYRTLVGDAVQGADLGYKIHILYNLTAAPEPVSSNTHNDATSPSVFGWKLSSVPMEAVGYRPTAHVIFDSRHIFSESRLRAVENILYGTAAEDARLPSINELIDLLKIFDPRTIVPNPITGLAVLEEATSGSGDFTEAQVYGVYMRLPTHRLIQTQIDGIYQLS